MARRNLCAVVPLEIVQQGVQRRFLVRASPAKRLRPSASSPELGAECVELGAE